MPNESTDWQKVGLGLLQLAEADRAPHLVPKLDDAGVPTGETYDTRWGGRPDQPDPVRLRHHLAYLHEKYGRRYLVEKGVPIPEFVRTDPYESDGLLNSLTNTGKLALNQSITGELWDWITGSKPFDMEGFQPSGIEQVGAGVLSFLAPVDLAVTAGGGVLGGALAKGAQFGRLATTAARSAGAIGAYEGSRAAATERDIGAFPEAAGKGALLGAGVGGAAGLIPAQIGKGAIFSLARMAQNPRSAARMAQAGSRVAGETGRLGAEVAAFGTGSPYIFEGRAPEFDDYKHAAQFIVGIKAAMGTLNFVTRRAFNRSVDREAERLAEEARRKGVQDGEQFNDWMTERMTGDLGPEVVKLLPAPPQRLALPAPEGGGPRALPAPQGRYTASGDPFRTPLPNELGLRELGYDPPRLTRVPFDEMARTPGKNSGVIDVRADLSDQIFGEPVRTRSAAASEPRITPERLSEMTDSQRKQLERIESGIEAHEGAVERLQREGGDGGKVERAFEMFFGAAPEGARDVPIAEIIERHRQHVERLYAERRALLTGEGSAQPVAGTRPGDYIQEGRQVIVQPKSRQYKPTFGEVKSVVTDGDGNPVQALVAYKSKAGTTTKMFQADEIMQPDRVANRIRNEQPFKELSEEQRRVAKERRRRFDDHIVKNAEQILTPDEYSRVTANINPYSPRGAAMLENAIRDEALRVLEERHGFRNLSDGVERAAQLGRLLEKFADKSNTMQDAVGRLDLKPGDRVKVDGEWWTYSELPDGTGELRLGGKGSNNVVNVDVFDQVRYQEIKRAPKKPDPAAVRYAKIRQHLREGKAINAKADKVDELFDRETRELINRYRESGGKPAERVTVFGDRAAKPEAVVEERVINGKRQHLLTYAKTLDAYDRAMRHVDNRGGNLYLAKGFDSHPLFDVLQSYGLVSQNPIGGRYKAVLSTSISNVIEAHRRRAWIGGLPAKERQSARFFGSKAVDWFREHAEKIKPVFLFQTLNRFKTQPGGELTGMTQKVFEMWHRMSGTQMEMVRQAGVVVRGKVESLLTGKKSMSDAQARRLYEDLIRDGGPTTKLGQEVRRILNDWYDYLVTPESEGGPGLKIGRIKDYFPRIIKSELRDSLWDELAAIEKELAVMQNARQAISDKAVLDVIKRKSQRVDEAVNFIYEREVAKVQEAAAQGRTYTPKTYRQILKELNREVKAQQYPTSRHEHARSLELPSSFYETDPRIVLPQYFNSTAKRAAESTVFGYDWGKVYDIVRKIEKTDRAEGQLANKLLSMLSGEYEIAHGPKGKIKHLIDGFVGFEVATKIALGRATLLNLTQPFISMIPDLGVFNTVKGGLALLDPKVRSQLRMSGAVDRYMLEASLGYKPGGMMGKLADRLAGASGFTGVNKMLMYLAASSIREATKSWQNIARRGGKRGEWAKQRLKDFGIDSNRPIGEAKMLEVMYRYATDSQLQANLLKDPLIFNDPHWRPFLLFKRFGYRQFTFMKDTLTREAKRGNYMPILRLAAGGALGGTLMTWATNTIKETLSGRPAYSEANNLWEQAVEGVALIGAFGMLSDVMEVDKLTRLSGAVKFAVEPVLVADVQTAFKSWHDFMRDIDNYGDVFLATRRNAHNVFSFLGSYPRYAAERLKTDAQQEGRTKYLRTEEKEGVIELILEGHPDEAKTKLQKWNKAYPEHAITLQDVSWSGIADHLNRRAQALARAKAKDGSPEYRRLLRKLKRENRAKLQEAR